MPEARRAVAARLPRVAAALAVAVALWLVARARDRVRATVPVVSEGDAFAPGAVHAVVEGPAASVLTLRVRPPSLREGARAAAGAPAPGPLDVRLPDGVRDVAVREVLVRAPAP